MFKMIKLLAVCSLTFAAISHAQERTWTSDDGKQLVGEMLRQDGETVVLKIGEKEFKVPLTRLSEDDRKWIADRAKELEAKKAEFATLGGTMKSFPQREAQQVTYHVYYPKAFSPENPLPMLILFSASARGKVILESFKDACEELGWIGVGCDTFRNGVDASELDPLFEELLPLIEKNVPHDPERLYMGGMSGGASRALQYTAKFDRPWKGIISCGGWLGKAYDLDYRKGMAVAWVNGDNDKNANAWVGKDSEVLKKRRSKTKLFQFPGGHVVGPPDTLAEAMRWVEANTK